MTNETGDREILVGFLTDQHDTAPRTRAITWGKLADYFLTNHEESPCTVETCAGAKCPHKSRSSVPKKPMAVVPGVVEGDRVDRNVRALSLLFLDFDHLTGAEAARVEAALAASGVERVVYTTHNHRPPNDIAFRVVVLLSRAVAADQWHRFLPRAIDALGCSVERVRDDGRVERQPDPTCKNRSRLYYFPSHPRGADHGAERVPGAPLDVDVVLARPAPALANRTADRDDFDFGESRPLPDAVDWDPADARAVADAAAAVFPESRRNEFCLALAGMLRRAGADEDTARWVVLEAARAGGSTAPEDRAKTVAHTYGLDLDSGAPMSGYSRLCEIVGEPAARAVGDAVSEARSNAFLRDVEAAPPPVQPGPPIPAPGAPAGANGHAGANGALVAHAPPPLPQVPPPAAAVDLAEVRRLLQSRAASLGRSLDRDDRVEAVVLRRALAGAPLAVAPDAPGGDPETVRAGKDAGHDPEGAVRSACWSAALALPLDAPWEAVAEVFRSSLLATPCAPPGDPGWAETARRAHRRAALARRVREAEEAARAARERAAAAAYHSAPPIPPGPPIPAAPPGDPPEPPDDPSWQDDLRKRGDGSLMPIPHNARVILERDPQVRGALGWNEVTKRVEVRRKQGPLSKYAGSLPIEQVATGVQDWIASTWDIAIPYQDVTRRAIAVARSRPFDPLAEYLRSIRWDGQPRVGGWLVDYCGAEDNEYNREVGRRWLTALVARGLKPGTKVDNVLVLEGLRGLGKSSFFEILGGDWFCDTAVVIGDKDSQMLAGRYWICELAEMVSIKKTGQHALKHFFSSRVDKFRPPYGASLEEAPRRCLFVGTTNDGVYLTDETGNRKYWCVAVVYVEDAVARLRRDRDQILAEAVAIYQAAASCPACLALGAEDRCRAHRWWFGYDEISVTEEEADKRMVESPVRLKVESWWYAMTPKDRPRSFTSMDVAEAALDAKPAQVTSGMLISIGHALGKMKFNRRRDHDGLRTWRHFPTEALVDAPQRASGIRGNGTASLFSVALPSNGSVQK